MSICISKAVSVLRLLPSAPIQATLPPIRRLVESSFPPEDFTVDKTPPPTRGPKLPDVYCTQFAPAGIKLPLLYNSASATSITSTTTSDTTTKKKVRPLLLSLLFRFRGLAR